MSEPTAQGIMDGLLTTKSLMELADSAGDWGPWRLRVDNLTLVHIENGYDVDLERCTTSAQTLDWIMQVNGKRWGRGAATSGLVQTLDDVLYPQANLCSFGSENTINARKLRDLVGTAAGRWPELVVEPE